MLTLLYFTTSPHRPSTAVKMPRRGGRTSIEVKPIPVIVLQARLMVQAPELAVYYLFRCINTSQCYKHLSFLNHIRYTL